MGFVTGGGATLQCSFGLIPAVLSATPGGCTAGGIAVATTMDYQPYLNVGPFGSCTSLANPTVAAATAAAAGVLTPMPCTPVVVAPWVPGSPTVTVAGKPALTNPSTCMCAYGGVISVTTPGQFTVTAP